MSVADVGDVRRVTKQSEVVHGMELDQYLDALMIPAQAFEVGGNLCKCRTGLRFFSLGV